MTATTYPFGAAQLAHVARFRRSVALPQRLDYESDDMFAKRVRSIRALGTRWILHPAYVPSARHSNNLELWAAARSKYLQSIADAAKRDRERNPAFHRAQAVVAAVSN